jgi:hypothetical protein
MTMGDFIGMGSVSQMTGTTSENNVISWDSTGKVYVPGAYDKIWGFTPVNSVGGVSTVNFIRKPGTKTEVVDTGLRDQAPVGEIFCGFHAIVVVGFGELDMKYVENKDVKTVISPIDKRPKLPFWICRNSWGTTWPAKDGKNYYEGGIKVTVNGKEEILNIPPGYWLHAMYPNESLALDVPIDYEGTDYGATMVMTPLRSNSIGPTPKPSVSSVEKTMEKGTLRPRKLVCDTNWRDNEGYSCKDYMKEKWCTVDGKQGSGWNSRWGKISNFANREGRDALQACCECGGGKPAASKSSMVSSNNEIQNASSSPSGLSTVEIFGIVLGSIVFIALLVILIIYLVNRKQAAILTTS